MKRIICLSLAILMMFSIVGCSKKTGAVTISGMYTINADVTMDDFKGSVSLNRLGSGGWEINFSKPDNLKGMQIAYQNDTAKVTFKGLSFDINREDIPVKAIAMNMTGALEKIASGKNVKYTKNNGKITAKGSIDDTSFEVLMNEKNNNLISINMKDIGLKAKFSDFKPMK